ncbi:MAG: iron ABC transporter substrate-binding protein [Acidimicrobiia bacterium]|nr:iron ABC transporter substrate-binding protein [Acidimicrobiia bacterium]
MRRITLLAVVAAIVASGCSSSGDAHITLYSGRSEDLVQPVIDAFTKDTGINVVVKYADSADLAGTILEEGAASPADVFFAQDPASLGTVALAGLFETLPNELLGKVPSRFSDDAGHWVGTSGRARVVVYDPTSVSEATLPPTEDAFVDEQWKGRVGIAPTNGSFLAFVAAKILIDGEESTLTWLKGMAANNSPTYPKNSPIVAAVNAGEIDAGLVNHYYLLRALSENPDVVGLNYFFPEPTAGSLVMPAGAGILSSSEHKDEGRTFIEWLLNDESQTYFADETFEYPMVPGVAANPALPPIDTIATPDINLSDLAGVLDLATDLVADAGLL